MEVSHQFHVHWMWELLENFDWMFGTLSCAKEIHSRSLMMSELEIDVETICSCIQQFSNVWWHSLPLPNLSVLDAHLWESLKSSRCTQKVQSLTTSGRCNSWYWFKSIHKDLGWLWGCVALWSSGWTRTASTTIASFGLCLRGCPRCLGSRDAHLL